MKKGKKIKESFALEVASVRFVKDAHILSETKIQSSTECNPFAGEQLCNMNQEVVRVINLKRGNTLVNCHFASVGTFDFPTTHPIKLLKTNILSNVVGIISVTSVSMKKGW